MGLGLNTGGNTADFVQHLRYDARFRLSITAGEDPR